MKLGISSYFDPSNSPFGVAVHVHNMGKELTRIGCEVHVFTSGANGGTTNQALPYVLHHIKPVSTPMHFESVVSFTKTALRKMLMMHFDVLSSHGWNVFMGMEKKKLLKVPTVHTIHSVEAFKMRNGKNFDQIVRMEKEMRNANVLIAVSNAVKEDAALAYGVPVGKMVVIPNGVDARIFKPRKPKTELFEKYGIPEDKHVILYVGRNEPAKGSDRLPKIIKSVLMKRKDVFFLNILPFLHKNGLTRLSKRFPENINIIRKPVQQNDLSELYNSADVYLQPSRYESFGLSVLEAMATGKAVIASPVGGISELVTNGENGILCDHRHIGAEIVELLEDDHLRKKLGKNARKKAVEYNWKKITRKTFKVFQAVCQ